MAGKVLNIKFCSPLKQFGGLTGKCHEICHYSYNLPLAGIVRMTTATKKNDLSETKHFFQACKLKLNT